MKAFLLVLALLAAAAQAQTASEMGMTEDEHAHMHDLPQGTGAAPDGGAWLRCDVEGVYAIHNGELLGYKAASVLLRKGGLYRVLPHKGPLIWTRPDGVQEQVPATNLYPPMTVAKSPT